MPDDEKHRPVALGRVTPAPPTREAIEHRDTERVFAPIDALSSREVADELRAHVASFDDEDLRELLVIARTIAITSGNGR